MTLEKCRDALGAESYALLKETKWSRASKGGGSGMGGGRPSM